MDGGSVNANIRPFVRPSLVYLKLLIFIFLAQIYFKSTQRRGHKEALRESKLLESKILRLVLSRVS